jgi:hypothetical protein
MTRDVCDKWLRAADELLERMCKYFRSRERSEQRLVLQQITEHALRRSSESEGKARGVAGWEGEGRCAAFNERLQERRRMCILSLRAQERVQSGGDDGYRVRIIEGVRT